MFFRILLIAMIVWGIFRLYRMLTGKGAATPFKRPARPKRYQGKAVDAEFEDLDDKSDRN